MAKEHLGLLLTGLVVGDSLGSTSEFTSREEVLALYDKYSSDGWPFAHVGGGYCKWNPGQVTDDTESALILAKSYLEHGKFVPEDYAQKLAEWGKGEPQDVGTTTLLAIGELIKGVPWNEAALKDFQRRPMNASNGSLLRNGIVPGMADSLEEAYRISLYQGIITHYAPRPVLACALQTFIIREFLEGRNPLKYNWAQKKTWLKDFHDTWSAWFEKAKAEDEIIREWASNIESRLPAGWNAIREADFDPDSYNPYVYSPHGGAGYVITTLQIAIWATRWSLRDEPFPVPAGYPQEVFKKRGPMVLGWVAMAGGDTDSYGSTAGPMIAAAHKELPGELLDGIALINEQPDLFSVNVKA